jgi:SpoVK/Ycf46/Vps4 family AAA+-type ATPase
MPGAHQLVEATSGAQDRTRVSQRRNAPMVFLIGPPGSGKSALGPAPAAEPATFPGRPWRPVVCVA